MTGEGLKSGYVVPEPMPVIRGSGPPLIRACEILPHLVNGNKAGVSLDLTAYILISVTSPKAPLRDRAHDGAGCANGVLSCIFEFKDLAGADLMAGSAFNTTIG